MNVIVTDSGFGTDDWSGRYAQPDELAANAGINTLDVVHGCHIFVPNPTSSLMGAGGQRPDDDSRPTRSEKSLRKIRAGSTSLRNSWKRCTASTP